LESLQAKFLVRPGKPAKIKPQNNATTTPRALDAKGVPDTKTGVCGSELKTGLQFSRLLVQKAGELKAYDSSPRLNLPFPDPRTTIHQGAFRLPFLSGQVTP